MSQRQPKLHIWSDLPVDRPMGNVERRRVMGEKMMVASVLLRKGFDLKRHRHENEQIAVVVSGKVKFGLGDEGTPSYREVIVYAGQVLELPANAWHSVQALEDSHVFDLFSPVSEKTGIDQPSGG